jgi:inorganic phosphate transporter, PiT family
MTDIALPGSIEPAKQHGPKLDHAVNPITAILFMGALAAGILFVAYSIYSDIDATGTRISSYLPFLLLFVALLIALGFEFVNGFHDTANAVATVIYTRSLPANTPSSGPECGTCSACCGRPAPSPSASSRCCPSN